MKKCYQWQVVGGSVKEKYLNRDEWDERMNRMREALPFMHPIQSIPRSPCSTEWFFKCGDLTLYLSPHQVCTLIITTNAVGESRIRHGLVSENQHMQLYKLL